MWDADVQMIFQYLDTHEGASQVFVTLERVFPGMVEFFALGLEQKNFHQRCKQK